MNPPEPPDDIDQQIRINELRETVREVTGDESTGVAGRADRTTRPTGLAGLLRPSGKAPTGQK
jgi:hypothetical protein